MARLPATLPNNLLSEQADRLVSGWMGSYTTRPRVEIAAYLEMIRTDRISRLCVNARKLMALLMFGEYCHPDPAIEEEVRSGIANMAGDWNDRLAMILNFDIFGHSFTEKRYAVRGGSAVFAGLRTLNPRKFRYEGNVGAVERVIYTGSAREVTIPYANGIHFVENQDLVFDNPYGWSLCESAFKFWELEQLIWGCVAIAAQRQATPILALKTDSSAYTFMTDSHGQPLKDAVTGEPIQIPLRSAALDALENVGNSGALVIDRMDDLIAVNQQTDGKFFQDLIFNLRQCRLEAFMTPPTLIGIGAQSGVGDSGLSGSHQVFFVDQMRAKASKVASTLIEEWVKPLLIWNHGELKDGYGWFDIPQKEDETAIAFADQISFAVARGAFTAEDENVITRLKNLLKVEN